MTIVTKRVDPPVPTRQYDWVAYVDGGDENVNGRGPTEAEALRDLCEQLAEQDAYRAAMREAERDAMRAQEHEARQRAEWHAEMRRDAFGA